MKRRRLISVSLFVLLLIVPSDALAVIYTTSIQNTNGTVTPTGAEADATGVNMSSYPLTGSAVQARGTGNAITFSTTEEFKIKATNTNLIHGVTAADGGKVTFAGNVEYLSEEKRLGRAYGINVTGENSSVSIVGGVSVLCGEVKSIYGLHSSEKGSLVVGGSVTIKNGELGAGVVATKGGQISVAGSVEVEGESRSLYADTAGSIVVKSSVKIVDAPDNYDISIYAEDKSNIHITGPVNITKGKRGDMFFSNQESHIKIDGNVTLQGGARGLRADNAGKISVGGSVTINLHQEANFFVHGIFIAGTSELDVGGSVSITAGNKSSGISGHKVRIGGSLDVAVGEASRGIALIYSGLLTTGGPVTITAGSGSIGILSERQSDINLKHGGSITMASPLDRALSTLSAGYASVNESPNQTRITGEGVFQIKGSMATYSYLPYPAGPEIEAQIPETFRGHINMTFLPKSHWTGAAYRYFTEESSWQFHKYAAGLISITANDSLWDMIDSSEVTNLTLSGTRVNFGGASQWAATALASSTNEVERAPQLVWTPHLSDRSSSYLTLQTDTLASGGSGGLFAMRGNVEGQRGDLLHIAKKSSGSHHILFRSDPSAPTTGTKMLQLVRSDGKIPTPVFLPAGTNQPPDDIPTTTVSTESFDATFVLAHPGAVVELGGFVYELGRAKDSKVIAIADDNPNNWYLFTKKAEEPEPKPKPKPEITPAAQTAINLGGLTWLMARDDLVTLQQRMGELRNDSFIGEVKPDGGNNWFRYSNSSYKVEPIIQLSGLDVDLWNLQYGRDWRSDTPGGTTWWGIMGGLSRLDADFSKLKGNARIKGLQLGAYGTYLSDSGFYADGVLKHTWYNGDFSVHDTAGKPVTARNMSNRALSASIEVGQRFYSDSKTRQGLYIEPQAQLSYTRFSSWDLRTSAGLNVQSDSLDSLIGRIGFHIGLDRTKDLPVGWNIYGKVMYEHEFLGDSVVRLNGTPVNHDLSDGWWTYGLGFTLRDTLKGYQGWLEFQRSEGGRYEQKWKISAGLRFDL